MGILDLAGEIAGAVAAVEGAEKLDPNAGLFTKGIAAVAGFKGAGALESMVGRKEEAADADVAAPDAEAGSASLNQGRSGERRFGTGSRDSGRSA